MDNGSAKQIPQDIKDELRAKVRSIEKRVEGHLTGMLPFIADNLDSTKESIEFLNRQIQQIHDGVAPVCGAAPETQLGHLEAAKEPLVNRYLALVGLIQQQQQQQPRSNVVKAPPQGFRR